MAIGVDKALPAANKPAFRTVAPSAPQASAGAPATYTSRPPAISDRTTQALSNNMAVAGYGTREMASRDMDRAGVSRGRGQAYYADVAQTQADSKAQAASVGAEMEAASANAKAQADYDNTMRAEQRANANLLENLRSNAAAERTARAGRGQDIYEALARGQFGLDSMNLDTTPLLYSLLRG